MKNLYDTLQKKEATLHQIVSDMATLRERLNNIEEEVNALRIAAKILADDDTKNENVAKDSKTHWQMIRTVLLEWGRPLHVKDISSEIDAKFDRKITPDTISSMIYRYIKAGKYFKKTEKPNTFALVEWMLNDNDPPVPGQPNLGDLKEVTEMIAPHSADNAGGAEITRPKLGERQVSK